LRNAALEKIGEVKEKKRTEGRLASTFVTFDKNVIKTGLDTFDGKGQTGLLRADSRAAVGHTAVSGTPKRLNYCIIFYSTYNLDMWPQAA